ncbi:MULTISPECIES: hypothetical protein [unclassified Streptomyces]|uniref:hypothetical protein n=1 Tax=unclassified Streptomyces TaxID=2593676 RepID=UPI0004BDA55E|nr:MULTISPECIES: hypothetical protein [unclassified Streptomyces]
MINKGLAVRGAQQHGRRYLPMLIHGLAAGELSTAHLATRTLPSARTPRAYDTIKEKRYGCVRAVPRQGR